METPKSHLEELENAYYICAGITKIVVSFYKRQDQCYWHITQIQEKARFENELYIIDSHSVSSKADTHPLRFEKG